MVCGKNVGMKRQVAWVGWRSKYRINYPIEVMNNIVIVDWTWPIAIVDFCWFSFYKGWFSIAKRQGLPDGNCIEPSSHQVLYLEPDLEMIDPLPRYGTPSENHGLDSVFIPHNTMLCVEHHSNRGMKPLIFDIFGPYSTMQAF